MDLQAFIVITDTYCMQCTACCQLTLLADWCCVCHGHTSLFAAGCTWTEARVASLNYRILTAGVTIISWMDTVMAWPLIPI